MSEQFEVSDRTCKIGGHVNVRTQRHGVEEIVTALDFYITVPLERLEVNRWTSDEEGYDRMFRQEGERLEPAVKSIRPIRDSIESARVEVGINGAKMLVLGDCKLTKARFEPQTKGACQLRTQVQCAPKLDVGVVNLLRNLGSDEARITIKAQNEQQSLNLPEGDAAEKKSRGRKPKGDKPKATSKAPTSSPKARRTRKTNGAEAPPPVSA